MKRKSGLIFVSVLFLLIFSIAANAQFIKNQNPDYRLLHMWFTSTDGENGVSTLTYDSKGNAHKVIWHLIDGSRSSLNLQDFDANGNMIKKVRLFSDHRDSTQIFIYDAENHLIKETFDRTDGVKGEAKYEYDAQGRLAKVDCRKWNGWLTAVITFEYDGQGQAVDSKIEREGKPLGSISYVYNDLGNLDTETWKFVNDFGFTFRYEYDSLVDAAKKHFTYSSVFVEAPGDERVVVEKYDYSGKVSGFCDNMVFDNGALQYKEYKRSDGLVTNTDYFYDVRNRLTKSYRRYPDGKSAFFTYEFDDNDRMVKKLFFRSDGVKGHEIYSYSPDGKLIKADWLNFDSWLTGALEFSHDEDGRITKGTFKGEKFDADIDFSYNNTGLISRIHWTFSFKDTQTYEFEWGKVEE